MVKGKKGKVRGRRARENGSRVKGREGKGRDESKEGKEG